LWHNLGQAVEKTVITHRACLRESTTATTVSREDARPDQLDRAVTADSVARLGAADVGDRCTQLRARTRERYDAVQRLRAQGKGLRTIATELDIDRKTARRFAAAASPDDIIAATTARAGILDEYIPHLLARWNAGCTNVAALTAELRELGYRGSPNTVYRFLRPYQASKASARPVVSPPPKPRIRAVTGWVMRDPDTLPDAETQQLTTILGRCPELAATRRHVGMFAVMMRDRRGDRLPEWIAAVRADDLPALHSFVTGLEHDFAAVTAGLTLPWSNGPTEGTVNIKVTWNLAPRMIMSPRGDHGLWRQIERHCGADGEVAGAGPARAGGGVAGCLG